MWEIPTLVYKLLKQYTGEILPSIDKPKDSRRTFTNEFCEEEQKILLNWLNNHKSLIVSDILKGRGKFSAEWMLVAQKVDDAARWIFKTNELLFKLFWKWKN